jgi:hypothetical protein
MNESMPDLGNLEREVMQLITGGSRQRLYARNSRGASRNRRFAPCFGESRKRVT